ncbi:hypothetical protein BGZ65_005384 [Modicella reniformis]|uniref:CENP-C homolog n=1 Tax=Modicella reniformis TaxID=1440133 RepID=A0A9P6IN59_9FUNG|nr:hypothetical protein BGZ65_005384 [Modicella reniformis]
MIEVPIDSKPEDQAAGYEEGAARRSKRIRYKPLAFWKNERLIFNDKGPTGTPKAVLRVVTPHVPVEVLLAQSGEARQMQQGVVIDHATGETITRPIMEPKGYVKFRDAPGGQYQFHRGLEDDSFSSGIIRIPGHSQKPNQNAFLSSVIFYVVEGHVRVTIYKNSRKFGPGDRFMVPRGNQYMVENFSQKECALFFVQNKSAVQAGATYKDFAAYAEAMTSSGLVSASSSASVPVPRSTAESATRKTLQTVHNSTLEKVRRSSRLTKTNPPSQPTSGKGPKVDPEDGFDDLFDLRDDESEMEQQPRRKIRRKEAKKEERPPKSQARTRQRQTSDRSGRRRV